MHLRRDAEPILMTFGIIGMTAWSYQCLPASGPLEPEAVADQLADLALVGLVVS